jgi:hypothetical protein
MLGLTAVPVPYLIFCSLLVSIYMASNSRLRILFLKKCCGAGPLEKIRTNTIFQEPKKKGFLVEHFKNSSAPKNRKDY